MGHMLQMDKNWREKQQKPKNEKVMVDMDALFEMQNESFQNLNTSF